MNILIKGIHSISECFSKVKLVAERMYIRLAYRDVVNDLRIHDSEHYEPEGKYVTMNDIPPSNYKAQLEAYNCDQRGVRRHKIINRDGKQELVYNSIHIAQQGLTEYGYYLADKNENHLRSMEAVAKWIIENQDQDTGAWINRFDLYNPNVSTWLNNPWISAMGEGQIISFLCRYYHITGEQTYLDVAVNGLKIFHKDVSDGGVVSYFNGFPVYEEYPTNPPSFTLNGFIYALFGLYDLYKTADCSEAKELFEKGLKTLEHILPYYDDSHLTYYDLGYITAPLRNPRQNSKYHLIHIKLLQALYSVTNNKTVQYYAKKWSAQ